MISRVSPRTRNVPRLNARSFRVYWMSTSRRSSLSRSYLLPDGHLRRPVEVFLRGAQTVDRRDGRDHHDVAPGEQAHRRRVPQPLDLLVDRRVLLDVGVGLRDVGLGLVVVVVADEIFDRVVRHQVTELLGQLGGQGLVGREDQRRTLQPLDQPRRRRALAGAGGAEQHDMPVAGLHPAGQILDGRRLVAGGPVIADHLEVRSSAGCQAPCNQPYAAGMTVFPVSRSVIDRIQHCDCVAQVTGLPSTRRPLAAADRVARPASTPAGPPGARLQPRPFIAVGERTVRFALQRAPAAASAPFGTPAQAYQAVSSDHAASTAASRSSGVPSFTMTTSATARRCSSVACAAIRARARPRSSRGRRPAGHPGRLVGQYHDHLVVRRRHPRLDEQWHVVDDDRARGRRARSIGADRSRTRGMDDLFEPLASCRRRRTRAGRAPAGRGRRPRRALRGRTPPPPERGRACPVPPPRGRAGRVDDDRAECGETVATALLPARCRR